MDTTQISLIAVSVLTPLAPYLIKVGESIAQEVGKAIFGQAKALYTTLKKKFEQAGDEPAQNTLEMLYKASDDQRQQLVDHIVQQAQNDTAFAHALETQVNDISTLLFECLQNKFLLSDLKQVYFRLGIGWNDLIGEPATRSEKAIALIEHIRARERVPDLIKVMWIVFPGLKC